MEAITVTGTHISMFRKTNTWYTIKDGNWNDPSVWVSNGRKKYTCPQMGDDVFVGHNIDYSNSLSTNIYIFNNSIRNLTITGKLTANGVTNQNKLIITGNLNSIGTIDFSSTSYPISIYLNGNCNVINSFISGIQSNIIYNSQFDQEICPISYYNLETSNGGNKSLKADLFVYNTLTIGHQTTLYLGDYNYTVYNTSILGALSKTSYIGQVNFNNLYIQDITGTILFSSNPTINLTGDFTGDLRGGVNLGSGNLNVNSNSTWLLKGSANVPVSTGLNNVKIGSGVTMTIGIFNGINGGGWINNGSVNGTDITSILNVDGTYSYGNTNIAMPIGIFNYNNSGTSCIQIQSGVTLPLPKTIFYDLNIQGNGTITGDTIINNNLSVSGSLILSSYNFTCYGICSLSGPITKSGTGIVNLNSINFLGTPGSISFTSNPTVNLSGNIVGDCRAGFNLGTGTINILGNVTLGLWVSGNIAPDTSINFLIASGCTLTNSGINATLGGFNTIGTINGVDSTSTFDNRSVCTYSNPQQPMLIGKLFCNQSANTFIYGNNGNQDISVPADSSPGYQNLILNGSGTKKLLGNISVKGTYTITSPAILNTNGFTLSNP